MVLETAEEATARWTFDLYVGISKANQGRGGNEPVTLFSGDEILLDYAPPELVK